MQLGQEHRHQGGLCSRHSAPSAQLPRSTNGKLCWTRSRLGRHHLACGLLSSLFPQHAALYATLTSICNSFQHTGMKSRPPSSCSTSPHTQARFPSQQAPRQPPLLGFSTCPANASGPGRRLVPQAFALVSPLSGDCLLTGPKGASSRQGPTWHKAKVVGSDPSAGGHWVNHHQALHALKSLTEIYALGRPHPPRL